MKNVRRIQVYALIVCIIILASCTKGPMDFKEDFKSDYDQNLKFYIATDLHYLSNNLNDHGEAFENFVGSGDGKQLEYIDEILDGFIYEIEKTNPDFLIISGDLTSNGGKESHLELSKKLEKIEKGDTSVYVIPGNHDILNPWARKFEGDKQYVTESITQEEFRTIYGSFGYDESVLHDESTLSYLVTPSEDVWLLMLDTNKYDINLKLGFPQADGEISDDTLNWIKKCIALAQEKGATIIPVMHHNIVDHSELFNSNFTLNNSEEVMELFKDNDINLVFSGHIHIQDIASDKNNEKELYDVASNSLAVYPHQYGVLEYSHKDNTIKYSTSKVDVSSWSKHEEINDENLNNFSQYSADYFGDSAYGKAYEELTNYESFSEEEIKLMSQAMKILNLRYFAGTENLNSQDVIKSEAFELWERVPDSFLKRYVFSIISDKDTEDNYLDIKIIEQ